MKSVAPTLRLFAAATFALASLIASHAAAASRIAGTVTDAGTGVPLPDVVVTLGRFDILGGFNVEAAHPPVATDAAGRFVFEDVRAGTWGLRAEPAEPYASQVYPDWPCMPGRHCIPSSLGGIHVDDGDAFTADMQLGHTGTISGLAVDERGAAPLADAAVRAVRQGGGTVDVQVRTDAAGRYLIERLPPGDYRVFAEMDGFVAELYPGVPCVPGSCTSGAAGEALVAVASGRTTPVDFALGPGGTLAGRVRETGARPLLYHVGVQLVRRDGASWTYVGSMMARAPDGEFAFTGLEPATYALHTYGTRYVNVVSGDHRCGQQACNDGDYAFGVIALGADDVRDDEVLEVEAAGSIAGCVTASGSQRPIAGIEVVAYEPNIGGIFGPVSDHGRARTGADGCYALTHLGSDGYRLRTVNSAGYDDQVYPSLACVDAACPLMAGMPVMLGFDQDASGYDFVLRDGSSISGRVIAYQGAPALRSVMPYLFSPSTGISVRDVDLDALRPQQDGRFSTYGLAPGRYCIGLLVDDPDYAGYYFYNSDRSHPLPVDADACTPIDVLADRDVEVDVRLDPSVVVRYGFE